MLWLIQSVFRSIEIVLKFLRKPLSASIDPNWFSIYQNFFEIILKFLKKPLSVSINRKSWIRFFFFLNQSLTDSNLLFKKVFKLFSLSELDKASPQTFFRFPLDFLQGFPLYKPVSPLCPSFCFLFHVFMHFIGYFRHFSNWDFCWFKPLFLKLIIGFCPYNVIIMIYDV